MSKIDLILDAELPLDMEGDPVFFNQTTKIDLWSIDLNETTDFFPTILTGCFM